MTIAQQLNIKEFPFIIKDADGKEIYREWSDGVWSKREWDGGEMIRYEDSYGYWSKWEWADGNRMYREDSDGYWEKREWDGGEMIRYEDSNGVIIDNRPKTDIQKAIEVAYCSRIACEWKTLLSKKTKL
jgi:hypothetical protein